MNDFIARRDDDVNCFVLFLLRHRTWCFFLTLFRWQLNKDKTSFQRIFVQDVRKCDDMLRILRYIKDLMHAVSTIRAHTHVHNRAHLQACILSLHGVSRAVAFFYPRDCIHEFLKCTEGLFISPLALLLSNIVCAALQLSDIVCAALLLSNIVCAALLLSDVVLAALRLSSIVCAALLLSDIVLATL